MSPVPQQGHPDTFTRHISGTQEAGPPNVRCMNAVITGGTSGLGLAMATALAESGVRVALTGRSAERAAEVAGQLPGAIGIGLDTRDRDSVRRAVDEAWTRLGGIDLLVNNAGRGMNSINPRFLVEPPGFWEVSPDDFQAVIDTNLVGYFLVAREVVPRMLEAGGGRIVNIAIRPEAYRRPGFSPYAPSRAGTDSLSRIMAADLRHTGIRVNQLLPGGTTATGMVPLDALPEGEQVLPASIMAKPIVWLASDAAADVHDERISAVDFDEWLAAR
ncbi:SDR family oxidoreductase [Pseudonocardiaceae bacterium YIM PH 21723]|nr:SDR family oxidoreductase [Pseudonocardiaceae bacterium YIM PH 21723]